MLLDHAKVDPRLWSVAPRNVSIALTNACDLKCPYCYAPKAPAELEFGKLCSWIDELDANGCLGVGFGGGEPTLYRRFAELCAYVAQETNLAVTFTTHAHWIDAKLVSQLAGNVHFVRVSVDGIGPTYESLRGKSFSELQRKLELLRGLAPFGVNYVVNRSTIPELDRAAEFAIGVGAAEFLVLPEQSSLNSAGIDDATLRALELWVMGFRGKIALAVSEAGAEGLPIVPPLANETGLRAYAHIGADGTLKKSSFEKTGVAIDDDGALAALTRLGRVTGETSESLAQLRLGTFS